MSWQKRKGGCHEKGDRVEAVASQGKEPGSGAATRAGGVPRGRVGGDPAGHGMRGELPFERAFTAREVIDALYLVDTNGRYQVRED